MGGNARGQTGRRRCRRGYQLAPCLARAAVNDEAYRRVSDLLYTELRQHAALFLRRQQAGDLLQTRTALVHETFLRLTGANQVDWQDRRHFLAVAGRTMRRALVYIAREQRAAKRGGGAPHVPLTSGVPMRGPSMLDFVGLNAALDKLATLDARKVQVIELRFFAGLTVEETAQVLDVSPDTVARDWRMARTWLLRELDTGRART